MRALVGTHNITRVEPSYTTVTPGLSTYITGAMRYAFTLPTKATKYLSLLSALVMHRFFRPNPSMMQADMAIDAIFPHSYECEWLLETPPTTALLHDYYPGASVQDGRDGVLVKVRSERGHSFIKGESWDMLSEGSATFAVDLATGAHTGGITEI